MREETGLIPERFYPADVLEQLYEVEANCVVLVLVFVGFVGEGAVTLSEGEHDDYRCISADEASSYLPFDQRSTVALIEREFVRKEPNELLRILPWTAPRLSAGRAASVGQFHDQLDFDGGTQG
jgi:dATP pyrophosphohydrolase